MSAASRLTVGVADLLRSPGSTREVEIEAILEGLSVLGSAVPPGRPITLDVRLEAVNAAVVAKGHVQAPWTGDCRRCLRAVEGRIDAEVLEVFENDPVEGETAKLHRDRIDLEPVAREAVLLELPLAPLCRDDCAGLCPVCGADRNVEDCGHTFELADDRWSALRGLEFDA